MTRVSRGTLQESLESQNQSLIARDQSVVVHNGDAEPASGDPREGPERRGNGTDKRHGRATAAGAEGGGRGRRRGGAAAALRVGSALRLFPNRSTGVHATDRGGDLPSGNGGTPSKARRGADEPTEQDT
jgi:hypothetical protein